jgi:hypothetical protein
VYNTIREKGGWNNWKMEIIGFFNCYDHYEARIKEQEYFLSLNANLNSIEPMPKPKEKPLPVVKPIKQPQICEICNVNCYTLKQLEIHKGTNKHKKRCLNKQMDNNTTPKNAEQKQCSFCDFKCSKKSDWERHIMRPKHQLNVKRYDKKTLQNASNIFSCNCGKIYKHYSGLWRHQQICIIEKPKENQDLVTYLMKQNQELIQNQNCIIEKPKEKTETQDLVTFLMAENKDFKSLLIEQNKTIIEAMKQHNQLT